MYLRKRDGVYHWRRKLPAYVAQRLGKVELVQSLRTKDREVAKSRATRLVIASERVYKEAMNNNKITTEQINDLACQWLSNALMEDEEFRLTLKPYEAGYSEAGEDVDGVETDIDQLGIYLAEAKEALSRNKLDFIAPVVREALSSNDIDLVDGSPEKKLLEKTMLRALAEFYRILKARRIGDYSVQAYDPLFSSVYGIGSVAQKEEDPAQESMLLSEVAEIYAEAKIRDGIWGEKTKRNSVPRIQTFIEIVEDRPIETVTRNMARDFREHLMDDLELANNTVGQCFKVVSAMFNWAKVEGVSKIDNPLKGLAPKEEKNTRLAYMPEDLEALFKTPLFNGHWRRDRREREGSVLVKDFKYWFPIIALHTGMRLEEISQLRTEDVFEKDGLLVINIVKSKTSAGERIVPIHPRLIDLGFMEYVNAQKKGQLWPELKQSSEGYYSALFAKWWPSYRRSQGLDKEGLVFHSFRHTFISWLQKERVPEDRIKLIVGHADQSITTGTYGGKLLSPQDLLDEFKGIDFGVDLSHLF